MIEALSISLSLPLSPLPSLLAPSLLTHPGWTPVQERPAPLHQQPVSAGEVKQGGSGCAEVRARPNCLRDRVEVGKEGREGEGEGQKA